MICCGLQRDSQFCPKCGKKLGPVHESTVRWIKAEQAPFDSILITAYPDRHRIPVSRAISKDEAELLWQELGELLGHTV